MIGQAIHGVLNRLMPTGVHLQRAFRDKPRSAAPHVVENLARAFPAKGPDEIERIAIDHAAFSERRVYLQREMQGRVKKNQRWWTVSGAENLQTALGEGRGVILVSAHFGHGKLIAPALWAAGFPIRLVRALGTGNEKKRRFGRQGNWEEIRAGLDVRPLLKALADNRVLVLLGDGMRSSDFEEAPIFHARYPFSTGFVKLAEATGSIVLPVFAIEENARTPLQIRICESMPIESSKSMAASVGLFSDALMDQLKQHPHQWHRWSVPSLFDNARAWADSEERWSASFGQWCLARETGGVGVE